MKTEFTNRFLKDLDKIHQISVKNDVVHIIEMVEKAAFTSEIRNIKKLKVITPLNG